MAELTFSTGFDAWVDQAHVDGNRSGGDAVRLQSAQRKGVIQIPVTGVRGKTVTSAVLNVHALDAMAAQTLTVKMLASGINPSKVTWNNLPAAVTGVTAGTVTIGATAAGASIAIPVTAILQAVAAGTKWHGFLITTDETTAGDANLRSFTSGKRSSVLVVEISDAPDKPFKLRPNDGAVSHAAPIVAWDSGETDHVAIQVQVDPDADTVSPAYDSGTQTTDDSQWDLSADGDFTPLSSGDDTQWRVRVQNADGAWSPWSDWASFTYTPKRTLVMDSPTGTTIGDPTFTVAAHLSAGTLTQYRIRVAKGADRTDVVYDSGIVPPDAGDIGRDIPWRDPDTHRRIIKGDDTAWQLNVRAWDEVDRAEAVGDPTYVETWISLTFDNDLDEAPADYTVTPEVPGSPIHVHSWTRSEGVDAWLIMHGSRVLEHLDPDDVEVDAGTYTWTDDGFLPPYQALSLHVRAVDAGDRSDASNTVSVTSRPVGIWILPDDGADPIRLKDTPIDQFAKHDRRESFKPLNVDTDVDLVYGYEGVSAQGVQTAIDTNNVTTEDVLAAVDRLEDIRTTPTARPRLVWASQSIRVQFKNLFALPRSDFQAASLKHLVSFDFIQDGD